jgi:hypothetical protein
MPRVLPDEPIKFVFDDDRRWVVLSAANNAESATMIKLGRRSVGDKKGPIPRPDYSFCRDGP